MATVNPIDFGPLMVGTASTLLYTCPSGANINGVLMKRVVFSNITSNAVTLTTYVVRSGGAVGAGNELTPGVGVAGNTPYVASELGNLVLLPGDSIYAVASVASAVNAIGSGFQM